MKDIKHYFIVIFVYYSRLTLSVEINRLFWCKLHYQYIKACQNLTQILSVDVAHWKKIYTTHFKIIFIKFFSYLKIKFRLQLSPFYLYGIKIIGYYDEYFTFSNINKS